MLEPDIIVSRVQLGNILNIMCNALPINASFSPEWHAWIVPQLSIRNLICDNFFVVRNLT